MYLKIANSRDLRKVISLRPLFHLIPGRQEVGKHSKRVCTPQTRVCFCGGQCSKTVHIYTRLSLNGPLSSSHLSTYTGDATMTTARPSCPLPAVLPGAARGAVEASAVLAASTERRPLRALRRELPATDMRIIAEPSSSAARQHGRSVRTEQSFSSGSRFYANVVVKLHRENTAREQARTNDEWLVDMRSRQRQQRERRAQKEQSNY